MADDEQVIRLVAELEAAGAQLSLALFEIALISSHASQDISEIAKEFLTLSCNLTHLFDSLKENKDLCRPALFESTRLILAKFQDVAEKLRDAIGGRRRLESLISYFKNPSTKAYFKQIESIQSAVTLVLHIILLAREENSNPCVFISR